MCTDENVMDGTVVRGCATDTQVRRGQNVRHCAPCESQEVNQILPGCKHILSSLDKDRETERETENTKLVLVGGKAHSHTVTF